MVDWEIAENFLILFIEIAAGLLSIFFSWYYMKKFFRLWEMQIEAYLPQIMRGKNIHFYKGHRYYLKNGVIDADKIDFRVGNDWLPEAIEYIHAYHQLKADKLRIQSYLGAVTASVFPVLISTIILGFITNSAIIIHYNLCIFVILLLFTREFVTLLSYVSEKVYYFEEVIIFDDKK